MNRTSGTTGLPSSIEDELLFFPHGRIPTTSVIHSRLHDLYPNFGLDVCDVVKLTFSKLAVLPGEGSDSIIGEQSHDSTLTTTTTSSCSTISTTPRKSSNKHTKTTGGKFFTIINRIRNNSSYIYFLVVAKSIGYPEKVLNLYRLNIKEKIRSIPARTASKPDFRRARRISRSNNDNGDNTIGESPSHKYRHSAPEFNHYQNSPARRLSVHRTSVVTSMSASSSTDNVFLSNSLGGNGDGTKRKKIKSTQPAYNAMKFIAAYPTKILADSKKTTNMESKKLNKQEVNQTLKINLNDTIYKFRNKHDLGVILQGIK